MNDAWINAQSLGLTRVQYALLEGHLETSAGKEGYWLLVSTNYWCLVDKDPPKSRSTQMSQISIS